MNDILKEHISKPSAGIGLFQYECKTKAHFNPGDKVKLEAHANDGEYFVWAED